MHQKVLKEFCVFICLTLTIHENTMLAVQGVPRSAVNSSLLSLYASPEQAPTSAGPGSAGPASALDTLSDTPSSPELSHTFTASHLAEASALAALKLQAREAGGAGASRMEASGSHLSGMSQIIIRVRD